MGKVERFPRPNVDPTKHILAEITRLAGELQKAEGQKRNAQLKISELDQRREETLARLVEAQKRFAMAMKAFTGEGNGPMPTPAELDGLPSLPDMQEAVRAALKDDEALSKELSGYETIISEADAHIKTANTPLVAARKELIRIAIVRRTMKANDKLEGFLQECAMLEVLTAKSLNRFGPDELHVKDANSILNRSIVPIYYNLRANPAAMNLSQAIEQWEADSLIPIPELS